MSNHQNKKIKLNMKSSFRKAVIEQQASLFVKSGSLVSTKPRIKAVQRFIEKLVTRAKNSASEVLSIRAVSSKLRGEVYSDTSATKKIVKELAPKYKERPGGYTRRISLGKRISDTAPIYKLLWV